MRLNGRLEVFDLGDRNRTLLRGLEALFLGLRAAHLALLLDNEGLGGIPLGLLHGDHDLRLLDGRFRLGERGLGLHQVGAKLILLDLHELLPVGDEIALLDVDLLDAPGELRGDRDLGGLDASVAHHELRGIVGLAVGDDVVKSERSAHRRDQRNPQDESILHLPFSLFKIREAPRRRDGRRVCRRPGPSHGP